MRSLFAALLAAAPALVAQRANVVIHGGTEGGAAAALAVKSRLPVHHVPIAELQRVLREQRKILAAPANGRPDAPAQR